MNRLKRKMLATLGAVAVASSIAPAQAAGPLLLGLVARHAISAAVRLATLPLVADQRLGWDEGRYPMTPRYAASQPAYYPGPYAATAPAYYSRPPSYGSGYPTYTRYPQYQPAVRTYYHAYPAVPLSYSQPRPYHPAALYTPAPSSYYGQRAPYPGSFNITSRMIYRRR